MGVKMNTSEEMQNERCDSPFSLFNQKNAAVVIPAENIPGYESESNGTLDETLNLSLQEGNHNQQLIETSVPSRQQASQAVKDADIYRSRILFAVSCAVAAAAVCYFLAPVVILHVAASIALPCVVSVLKSAAVVKASVWSMTALSALMTGAASFMWSDDKHESSSARLGCVCH
jgi:hypothetical protein